MTEVYSTNVSELLKKAKAPRAKKAKMTDDEKLEAKEPLVLDGSGQAPPPEGPPAKKPRTEKQLAADAKRKEAAVAKKAAKEAEKAALKAEEERLKHKSEVEAKAKEEVKEAKRIAAALKRKLAKEAKQKELQEQTPSVESGDKPLHPDYSPMQPDAPKHLVKFAENALKDQNQLAEVKKPLKQIKQEAQQAVGKMWDNPVKRAQVEKHNDDHIAKTFRAIFGSR